MVATVSFSGAPPRPPTRSRVHPWQTVPAAVFGMSSPIRRGQPSRGKPVTSPPTTITNGETMSTLMRDIGLNAYRFSLRWPRILPDGTGDLNAAGSSFYDRLVDELLAAGIEPFVTLFHWDLPVRPLPSRRAGPTPTSPVGSADYATVVANALGDRVKYWMTLNEPYVVSAEGHLVGQHAPGLRNIYATGQSVHNQLRAHVAGFQALKAIDPNFSVGLAQHDVAVWPASESEEDVAAAERAQAWHNFPLFTDPLVYGHYPLELLDRLEPYLPRRYEDDMSALRVAPDFIGLNYYQGYYAEQRRRGLAGLRRR